MLRIYGNTIRTIHKICIAFGVILFGAVHVLPLQFLNAVVIVLLIISTAVLGPPRKTRHVFLFGWAMLIVTAVFVVYGSANEYYGKLPSIYAWHELIYNTHFPIPDISALTMPVCSFLLALVIYSTDDDAADAIRDLSILGCGAAAVAILQFEFGDGTLLFGQKFHYLDSLTGTFVNRNTAATFFGLTLIAVLAQLARTILGAPMQGARKRQRGGEWASGNGRILAIQACGAFVCSVALLLTNSRAGIASTVLAALILLAIVSTGRRGRPGSTAFLLLGTGILGIAALAFSGRVGLRLTDWISSDARFCVLPSILAMIGDGWPWGFGFASFSELFPAYRDPSCGVNYHWSMAHNFYLEGLLSLGVVFAGLFIVSVVMAISLLRLGLRTRRKNRPLVAMGGAIFALCAFHSIFDFSIQIPGVAQYFSVLLAAAFSLCVRDSRETEGAPAAPREVVQVSHDYGGI